MGVGDGISTYWKREKGSCHEGHKAQHCEVGWLGKHE